MKAELDRVVQKKGSSYVYSKNGALSIKFQDGVVKDKGVNGIDISEAILLLADIIDELDTNVPCYENAMAIDHLEEAYLALVRRTVHRVRHNKEGTEKI